MRALPQHHQALTRAIGQQWENRHGHGGRRIAIPFRHHQQGGCGDLGRVPIGPAGLGIFAPIQQHAIGGAERLRVAPHAFRVGRPGHAGPMFKPTRRDQPGALAFRHTCHPAFPRLSLRHGAVSAQRRSCGATSQAWPITQPRWGKQHQAFHQRGVIGGEAAHQRAPPGPADMHQLRDIAPFANEGGGGADILHRRLTAHDGRIGFRRLVHLRRAGAAAIAANIQAPNVKALACDIIHPGQATERQVKRRMRRIGRAMHEKHRARWGEGVQVFRALITQEKLDPGIARRDHEFLGHQRGLGLGGRGSQQRRGQRCRQHGASVHRKPPVRSGPL